MSDDPNKPVKIWKWWAGAALGGLAIDKLHEFMQLQRQQTECLSKLANAHDDAEIAALRREIANSPSMRGRYRWVGRWYMFGFHQAVEARRKDPAFEAEDDKLQKRWYFLKKRLKALGKRRWFCPLVGLPTPRNAGGDIAGTSAMLNAAMDKIEAKIEVLERDLYLEIGEPTRVRTDGRPWDYEEGDEEID
jgi:hypothetical protein